LQGWAGLDKWTPALSPKVVAQEAASRNADEVGGVLAALHKLLGSGTDIKTINYLVVPNYKYPQGGGTPT